MLGEDLFNTNSRIRSVERVGRERLRVQELCNPGQYVTILVLHTSDCQHCLILWEGEEVKRVMLHTLH